MIPIEEAAALKASGKTPEQAASEEERLLVLRAALEQLPEPYKRTILQSLQCDSPEEIAVSDQISPGTVKSILSRARERLRFLLQTHLGGNNYEQF